MTGGAASAPLEIFVWFEADPADAVAVREDFARLRAAMAAPDARLLRRPDLRQRADGMRETWMEVWPGVGAEALPGWLERLATAAAAAGLAARARGGRHVEPFAPIA